MNRTHVALEPADRAGRILGGFGARTPLLKSPARRIWDLRRGDADDNRTSPSGRGWCRVVIATALESNYLAAAIAFVTLIVVPALLVGLAPPLLFAYGRQQLDAAAVGDPFAALLTADEGYVNLLAGVEATDTLMRGFTTVRDVGGNSFSLKRAIDEGVASRKSPWPLVTEIIAPEG